MQMIYISFLLSLRSQKISNVRIRKMTKVSRKREIKKKYLFLKITDMGWK